MGTSDDDGKAGGNDWTRLPVPNLRLCHWSIQFSNICKPEEAWSPSSTDVPVLLLSRPFDGNLGTPHLMLYKAISIKFLSLTFFPSVDDVSTVTKLSIKPRPLSLDIKKSRPCAAAAMLVIVPVSANTNWNSSDVSLLTSSLYVSK